mmetsp:Transcript_9631/g.30472  ORF Transcript_9631/g.30472 Transcript_9631/m.30472 type:complete len:415 (+) Transcript_9631:1225-2469(+)
MEWPDDVDALAQRREVLGAQVARAAVAREAADNVAVVKVVVGEMLVGPHALREHLDQPLGEQLGPLGEQIELLERHAAERREPRPERRRLHDGARELEEGRGDERARRALARARRRLHVPREPRQPDDRLQQPRHESGSAREHEVVPDDRAVRVPKVGGVGREMRAQARGVNVGKERVLRLAEEPEELVVRARADRGELELEEGELRAVHVNGDHLLRALEDVVEHVAAGARDGEYDVLRSALEHAMVDRRVLPRDVVDDLLLADRRHDEVLRVHVLHDREQLVREVGADERVRGRRAHLPRLPQHAHARDREQHVRDRLRDDRGEEECNLRVERQPTLARRRAEEVPAHPRLESDEVPAQKHHPRREHQLGEGCRRVDELQVKEAARYKVEPAKEQRRLALVLHLEEREDDDG